MFLGKPPAIDPSLFFFVTPERKRGVPPWGCRPERSKECLGLRSVGQSRGTFLNSPTRGLTKDKKAVFLYKKFTIQEAT